MILDGAARLFCAEQKTKEKHRNSSFPHLFSLPAQRVKCAPELVHHPAEVVAFCVCFCEIWRLSANGTRDHFFAFAPCMGHIDRSYFSICSLILTLVQYLSEQWYNSPPDNSSGWGRGYFETANVRPLEVLQHHGQLPVHRRARVETQELTNKRCDSHNL